MSQINVNEANPMAVSQMFIDKSNDEIRDIVSTLNPEQLAAVIQNINENTTPYWKGKIRAIILGLSTPEQLVCVGHSLTVPQLLDLFESNLLSLENIHKLLAILVGLPYQTFSLLLSELSEEPLQTLLETSFSEPLQHQLTVFIHEMNNRYLILSEELNSLLSEIETLSTEGLSRNDLMSIKDRINNFSLEFNLSLIKIKNALKIAWSTHRLDLIENLNSLKDKYTHTLIGYIGHPETSLGATGLYELLKERLNVVFGNPFDLNDPESISNAEPSIEALVKFSIWYIKDYWEVGLLPKIKAESQLELDPHSHTEQERATYRDKLFNDVKLNLEKLNLKTLWNLKKAHIYSKNALVEYIIENKKLIDN